MEVRDPNSEVYWINTTIILNDFGPSRASQISEIC